MKIDQLRQLLEISKTGSINQAAANLYISQPNLSLSIHRLEDELGCQLISRNNRGVSLTREGELFLEYAEPALNQFDRLRSVCFRENASNAPAFSIANMRFRYVNAAVAELYNNHKGNPIQLFISEADRDGVINLISHGDCDIGVIHMLNCYKKDILAQIKSKDLQFHSLSPDHPMVIVGRGSPLFYLDDTITEISPDVLQQYPHVRYPENDTLHYSDRSIRAGITRYRGEIIVSDRASIYDMLEYTDAFFIASANKGAYRNVCFYPNARAFDLAGCSLVYQIGWIKRNGYVPSPLALEFVDLLSRYFPQTDSEPPAG